MDRKHKIHIFVIYAALVIVLFVLVRMFKGFHLNHTIIIQAKREGYWDKIPGESTHRPCQKGSGKFDFWNMQVRYKNNKLICTSSSLQSIYKLIGRLNNLPLVSIQSFNIKKEPKNFKATIHLREFSSDCYIPSMLNRWKQDNVETFQHYQPRFDYVNAEIDIEGHKHFWACDQFLPDDLSCPIHHTLDTKTGKTVKGDKRPKLDLSFDPKNQKTS